MLTSRHPVDFPYTRRELHALFRYADKHHLEKGGRYDARDEDIHVWTCHWVQSRFRQASRRMGTWTFRWGQHPALWQLDVADGWTLDELLCELGILEQQAWGRVIHAACIPWEGLPVTMWRRRHLGLPEA